MSACRKSRSRLSLALLIPACCAPLPVANRSSVSLVDVSLSTVMLLNEDFTPSDNNSCNTGADRVASVKTNARSVAMSGAIIPDPLAIPLTVTLRPPIVADAVASLG